MRSKKTITILLIVMILTIISVPTLVMADPIDGSITIRSNTAPVIDSFTIVKYTDETKTATEAVGAFFEPTAEYKITMEVRDDDGLANLEEVLLYFWHETTAGDPTDLKAGVNEGDNDSSLVHWVRVEDTDGVYTFDNTLTSWETEAAPTVSTNLNVRTTDFDVKIGLEAIEAPTGTDTDKWIVGLRVTDEASATDFAVFSPGSPTGMAWYGDMFIDADSGPDWDSGTAGMLFGDDPQQMFTDSYRLKVVSNGTYDLSTNLATTWTDAGSAGTITYDAAATGANQFAMAVGTNPVYQGTETVFTDLGGGYTDTVVIPRTVWGSSTGFAGVYVNNIYLFLKTNATMTDSVQPYTGEINIIISNGT